MSGLTSVILVLGGSVAAVGEPLYDAVDCVTASGSVNDWTSSNQIFYYVDSDFASKMNDCTGHSLVIDAGCARPTCEDAFSQSEVRHVVQAAAETWNRESRGPALLYGGEVTAQDAQAACASTSMSHKPAVWVTFQPGCADANSNGVCDVGGAHAAVRSVPGDTNCLQLVVYGDQDGDPANPADLTNCPGSGIFACSINPTCSTPPKGWRAGVNYTPTPGWLGLQASLTHELGHALQLGHPFGTMSQERAVMVYDLADPPYGNEHSGWPGKRHLFIWDQDCVDDVATERSVEYVWRGYDQYAPTTGWTSVTSDSDQTQKSFLSGGHLRQGATKYYGRFDMTLAEVGYVDRGGIGTDGVVTMATSTTNVSGTYPDGMYTPPTLWAPRDVASGTGHDTRMLYVPQWTDFKDFQGTEVKTDIDNEDPPQLRYLDTDNLFSSITTGQLQACTNAFYCNAEPLRSHLPLSVAWDPVSQKSIIASVNTGRKYSAAVDPDDINDNGQISVHPGFTSSSLDTLRAGSNPKWSTTISVVYGQGNWPFVFETDSPPAVACGPSGTGPSSGGTYFNCLLAWVDRGYPGGSVLYTWFRVNGTLIQWIGAAHRRSGSFTVSGVSAAWFHGQFWMAWKSTGATHGIQYTSASTYPTGWGTVTAFSGVQWVVDPPTFLYVPDSSTLEAGLVWTRLITL